MKNNTMEERFEDKFGDPMEKKMGKGFALYCSYCSGEWREPIKEFIQNEINFAEESLVQRVREEIISIEILENVQSELISLRYREKVLNLPSLSTPKPKGDK